MINSRIKPLCSLLIQTALATALFLLHLACTDSASQIPRKALAESKISEIHSQNQFEAVLDAAGGQLLVFDFAADWCSPCKLLEPILEKIAGDTDTVKIYRIDYDQQQELALLFKVRGLPFVAFVQDKTIVYTLMGLHPEETYRQAIKSFSQTSARSSAPSPAVSSASIVTPIPQSPQQRRQAQ